MTVEPATACKTVGENLPHGIVMFLGKNLQRIPSFKIVQSWSTNVISESDEDCEITITLKV